MKILTIIILLLFSSVSSSIAGHYPFGLHGTYSDFNSLSDLGVSQVRFASLIWDKIESKKGNYDFTQIDNSIRKTQSANIQLIVATIRDINRWGGNKKAQKGYKLGNLYSAKSGFPSDIRAWKRFIQTVVERYDGDGVDDMPGLIYPVKYWQIEGEWMWQWKDKASNYIRFLDITYKEIKRADPSAVVISGAITGSMAFAVGEGFDPRGYFEKGNGAGGSQKVSRSALLASKEYWSAYKKEQLLLSYGKNSFDVLDVHLYSRDAYSIAPVMDMLRVAMTGFGYLKPVWSLENGGPFYGYSENIHAREVVKRYVLSLYSGIEKVFWSSLNVTTGWPEKYIRLSLIDAFGRKKQAYYTYKLLNSKLDGFDSIVKLDIGKGIYAFKVMKGMTVSYVLWSDKGGQASIPTISNKVRVTASVSLKTKMKNISNGEILIRLSGEPLIVEEF